MKNLLLIAITILAVGCGGKNQTSYDIKPPEVEKEELPPIPDKVTKEFVLKLWDLPNDETNLIEEIKNQGKAGIWIAKRKKGPEVIQNLSMFYSRYWEINTPLSGVKKEKN